ncbi:2-C-methyl-D-erythritol 4-phosphate cytidylyltransferase [Thermodesulfobacterium sp. TA1]|uniref:2-C-methyl-D-erythritol 4-phosphate cytidylyltransferase n=1 Tax=Thermodesulfobacterium sp. TA1 TaxID=2234087 RepID=UPI001231DD8D|nr:2-C-methyl-D-erythritol 4-phosphate cytidylyltransferase [Thermodesulfobacterium sp. TA1]QER42433.1 2-C-methyl-D-erythritol 4-phosphate cytidylyltransferase [Thermodesulfobacterium sp. TA1]
MIIAVIPAAGKGERLGEALPKQFLDIKEVPLLIRTLLTFEKCSHVDGIIIATHQAYLDHTKKLIQKFNLKKVLNVVEGGETRQKSVYKAVKVAPLETKVFLVHDAVRPFVSESLIYEVIKATLSYGAAVPAIPVRDTLNLVENRLVKTNIPRKNLFHIQTPQGIKAELLLNCLERALTEGLDFSDESSLLNHFGYPVYVVEGSWLNLKITFKEDLILAEKLIDCKIETLR